MRHTKRALQLAAFATVGTLFATLSSPALAQSCSIGIRIIKAGFVVGVSGGSGTLTCARRSYPLQIGGVSIGATIGASEAVLVGRAHNVRRVSDVAGTYSAARAGFAMVRGRGAARLVNAHGVVLELRGREVGLEFSVDLSGMQIALR
jgi:hypothetical protein